MMRSILVTGGGGTSAAAFFCGCNGAGCGECARKPGVAGSIPAGPAWAATEGVAALRTPGRINALPSLRSGNRERFLPGLLLIFGDVEPPDLVGNQSLRSSESARSLAKHPSERGDRHAAGSRARGVSPW